MPNRIWVDVEDLFQYSVFNARPSGIQRIELELCRALALMPETRDRVGFVRHASARNGFTAIPFAAVDALHARLTAAAASPPAPRQAAAPGPVPDAGPGNPGLARRIAYRIPLDMRAPLIRLVRSQRDTLHAAGSLAGVALKRLRPLARAERRAGRRAVASAGEAPSAAGGLTVAGFAATAEPDDVLLVLGSNWFHPFYGELVAAARERHGLRVALLIYDLIPLLRPEWCDANLVQRFRHWAGSLLPQADILLTISRWSGQDVVRFAERHRLPLRATPCTIPIGTGFSMPPGHRDEAPAGPGRLPAAGSYVLMVSTIEARKNHALLVRTWRRLLDALPTERVPTLVFAGKVGWLVDDLMQQLRNADWLGGKVVLVENPQDSELEQLYRGCLFTVFPSFYEGWGLPVTESFGFGRPCIISNASALPEAGGTLARYFDPENGVQAFQVLREAIEDPAGVEAWGARVAAEFRPVSWEESARGILRAIDHGRPVVPAADQRRGTGQPAAPASGRASHLV